MSYTYYKTGDASNITVKDEYLDAQTTPGDPDDYDWHHDLALYYDMGHKLRIGLWDRWKDEDGNGLAHPGTYEHSAAREFRYDPLLGPRARYVSVDYETADEHEPNAWTITEPIGWTDYDSLLPYQDLELTGDGQGGYDVTAVRRYLGTAADEPLDANGQPLDTRYYHQDLIGSTCLVTDENGEPGDPPRVSAYTAFGEALGDPSALGTRYRYVGGWGYESGLLQLYGTNPNLPAITLQHVGWRWYQADIGRFIQRDALGVLGALNVYLYCLGDPVTRVDPWGLTSKVPILPGTDGLPRGPNGWIRMPPGTRPKFVPGRGWIPVPRTPVAPPGPWWPGALRAGGAVCVAFGIGYGIGTAIDHSPRLFGGGRISGHLGGLIYRGFWPKPRGLTFGPGGQMTLP